MLLLLIHFSPFHTLVFFCLFHFSSNFVIQESGFFLTLTFSVGKCVAPSVSKKFS